MWPTLASRGRTLFLSLVLTRLAGSCSVAVKQASLRMPIQAVRRQTVTTGWIPGVIVTLRLLTPLPGVKKKKSLILLWWRWYRFSCELWSQRAAIADKWQDTRRALLYPVICWILYSPNMPLLQTASRLLSLIRRLRPLLVINSPAIYEARFLLVCRSSIFLRPSFSIILVYIYLSENNTTAWKFLSRHI